MIHAWMLIVIVCSGPGPSGDCVVQAPLTYAGRWDCRLASLNAEMRDERVRAYCQRGRAT